MTAQFPARTRHGSRRQSWPASRPTLRHAHWLAALLALMPTLAWSADVDNGAEGERVAAASRVVELPAFPKPENLIPFVVSATTDNEFMIDGESLAVSSDRVVSYTLVIVSSAGARSISYEAIRCDTAERRLYAFGHSDGTWSRARSDDWQKIHERTANRQHAALYREYFCPIGSMVRDADDARRVLRSGGSRSHLRP